MMLFYGALRSLGVDVDIRHPDHDLSGYAVDRRPGPAADGRGARRPPGRATPRTARLVFGPRTAYRTPTGRVHEDGQPGPLRDLVGLAPAQLRRHAPRSRASTSAATWSRPGPSPTSRSAARSLIAYDDGPLAGQAAVVRNGNAISIGAWSAPLVTSVLEQVLPNAGVPTCDLPDGVRGSRNGNTEIWMNFAQTAQILPDGSEIGPVSFQFRG